MQVIVAVWSGCVSRWYRLRRVEWAHLGFRLARGLLSSLFAAAATSRRHARVFAEVEGVLATGPEDIWWVCGVL